MEGGIGALGNFKGVMLSNRPGAESAPKLSAAQPGFKPAFAHEHVHPGGRDVDYEERMAQMQKRDKPKQTLKLKLLADLAALISEKNSLMAAKAEEERRAAERRARFQEKQAKLREAIRSQAISEPSSPAGDENSRPSGAYSHLDAKPSKSGGAGAKQPGVGAGGPAKPAWARSSAAVEAEEDEEADDLLDFVKDFDPDRYEEDLEDNAGDALLKAKLADVEEREARHRRKLAKIEARAARHRRDRRHGDDGDGHNDDQGSGEDGSGDDASGSEGSGSGDEGSDAGSSTGAAAGGADGGELAVQGRKERRRRHRRRRARRGSDDDEDEGSDADSLGPLPNRNRGGRDGDDDDRGGRGRGGRRANDAESIATSILSSTSSIRAVHSKKSMTTLVERTQREEKERIAAAMASGQLTEASAVTMPVLAPPRLVEHNELKESIGKVKNLVSNLPYQHRNPAV